MNRFALVSFVLIASCSLDQSVFVKPDPSGASSGESSTSSSAVSGGGGSSGGLSCDPCENKDGARIVSRRSITSSDDGFYRVEQLGYFDTKLNVPCQALLSEDGARRCVPYTGVAAFYYSDSACTVRVIGSLTCYSLAGIEAIAVAGQGQCAPSTFQPWSIGPEYLGPVYSLTSGGACNDVSSLRPNFKFNSTSGKLPASDFAPMTVESKP